MLSTVKVHTRDQALAIIEKCLSDAKENNNVTNHQLISAIRESLKRQANMREQQQAESSPLQGNMQKKRKEKTSAIVYYSDDDVMWVVCNAIHRLSQDRYQKTWFSYILQAFQSVSLRGSQ